MISVYLAATKLAGSNALFCEAGGGCDIVQSSRYAMFLGVPTAAWGAGVFAVIGALALTGLTPGVWTAAFVLAAAGAGFTAYLTYLELFVLRAICPWCVVVFVISLALVPLLVIRRPTEGRRRGAMRPTRVATLGAVAAVVAIVGAAGVYVAGEGSMASGTQEALARHLKESGAVFYGAFW